MDESLGAALEAAAARQRKSVVGRREGLPTKVLEGLGDIPMNMVGSFKNMMDAAYSHQPGTSIQDDPQYAGLVTENALNLIGVPALTGGVPASALGSAARRGAGGMIENQEVLKQLALDKRNAGRGSTQTVYPTSKAMYDAQGGAPPFADIMSGWRSQKGDALEEYRRAAFPERYADEAPSLLQQGEAAAQRDLDMIPFSNFTDKPTALSALAAVNVPRSKEGLITGYANKIDEVPIDWLKRMPGNELGRTDVAELMRLIEQQGLKDPLIINAGKESRTAKLGEGNHRLEALRRMGFQTAPTRVVVGSKWGSDLAPRSFYGDDLIPVPGEYFSADASPSQVFRSLSGIGKR